MKYNIKCILTGALSGIINGIFGAGGGMLAVPLLSSWVGLSYKSALATSVAAILPMSAASAIVYLSAYSVSFSPAVPYLIGGLLGGFIGGKVFLKIPTLWIRRLFAIFIIYGGVRHLL